MNLEVDRKTAAMILDVSEKTLAREGHSIPGTRKIKRSWRYDLPKLVEWHIEKQISKSANSRQDALEQTRYWQAEKLRHEVQEKEKEFCRLEDVRRISKFINEVMDDAAEQLFEHVGEEAAEILTSAIEDIDYEYETFFRNQAEEKRLEKMPLRNDGAASYSLH